MFFSSIALLAQDLIFHGKSSQQIPQLSCPLLELFASFRPCQPVVCIFEPFAKWCYRVPNEQKKSSTLGMVQFPEHYEKIQNGLLYFQSGAGVWIQSKMDPVWRSVYITRQKETKVSWTFSPNTSQSFNITALKPPCLGALNVYDQH